MFLQYDIFLKNDKLQKPKTIRPTFTVPREMFNQFQGGCFLD